MISFDNSMFDQITETYYYDENYYGGSLCKNGKYEPLATGITLEDAKSLVETMEKEKK